MYKVTVLIISMLFLSILLGCTPQAQPVQPAQLNPTPAEIVPPPQNNTEIPLSTTVATIQPSKITFVRDYGTYYGICTANSDGTDIKRIAKSSSMNAHPTWSPDGTQIVFESSHEWHGLASIYTMDANGNNVKCLTPEIKFCKSPSWSPDGKKVAYCVFMREGGKSDILFMPDTILTMDSNGQDKQNIANGWYPSWFPDSQHIAFFSARRQGIIQTINADGSGTKEYPTKLNLHYLVDNYPSLSVSPDSKSIAFDGRDFTGKRDIYILSLADGTVSKLTGNVSVNCYSPTWSPDGSKIAFTMGTSGDSISHAWADIYIMDADGSNPSLLIKNGMFPSWQG
jgi:Tol biopolymer transport system component